MNKKVWLTTGATCGMGYRNGGATLAAGQAVLRAEERRGFQDVRTIDRPQLEEHMDGVHWQIAYSQSC